MNILTVFDKLNIIEQSDTRLVLRDLPVLDWLFTGAMLLIALIFAIVELWITAGAAVIVGIVFVARAKTRLITFDAETNLMQIEFQSFFGKEVVNETMLHEISRAYLRKDSDGSSQILLVTVMGDELGLSSYSRDMTDWKEPVVIAINTVLHEAHKDDGDVATI
jgi:hypothetical protein